MRDLLKICTEIKFLSISQMWHQKPFIASLYYDMYTNKYYEIYVKLCTYDK